MTAHEDIVLQAVRRVAAAVPDPEIPVLTLADLGILRAVARDGERVVVTLTPTYTGCPATEVIQGDVRRALDEAGLGPVEVRLSLAPPWSSDDISEEGREKLRAYGIAPPACLAGHAPATGQPVRVIFHAPDPVRCPRCDARRVERIAEHGSTPCKALYRCLSCREPFDYFKPY